MKNIALISILILVLTPALAWFQQSTSTQSTVFSVVAEAESEIDGAEHDEPSEREADRRGVAEDQPEDISQSIRACESRADTVEQIVSRQNQRLSGFKDLIGGFVDEVMSVNSQLDVEEDEYGDLVEGVESGSEPLADQIEKVENLSDPIDCESSEPFEHLREYVAEYLQAIDYLEEYRNEAMELALNVYGEWVEGQDREQNDLDEEEGV